MSAKTNKEIDESVHDCPDCSGYGRFNLDPPPPVSIVMGIEDAFNALGAALEKLPSSSEQTQLSIMLQSFKRRVLRYQAGEPSMKLHFTNEWLKASILNDIENGVEEPDEFVAPSTPAQDVVGGDTFTGGNR